jgi:hypothetical protein
MLETEKEKSSLMKQELDMVKDNRDQIENRQFIIIYINSVNTVSMQHKTNPKHINYLSIL